MDRALLVVIPTVLLVIGCGSQGGATAAPDQRLTTARAALDRFKAYPKGAAGDHLRDLEARRKPDIRIEVDTQSPYRVSPDRQTVYFDHGLRLLNKSSSQVSEVAVVLSVHSAAGGGLLYSTKPQVFRTFHNDRIPNIGTLEPFSQTSVDLPVTFAVPSKSWTTQTGLRLEISEVSAAPDGGDLHDFGNLISYFLWHEEDEIRAAFLKDPSLFKLKSSVGMNPALLAAAEGSPKLLDFMIAHGVNYRARTVGGKDLMYCAVEENNPVMLDKALKLGFKPNERILDHNLTLLHVAARSYCGRSVKWLLDHHADPNAKDSANWTPLMYATASIEPTTDLIADDLIAGGADYHYHLANGYGLLHIASDQPVAREKLIRLGISVDDHTSTGITPLMVAAENGRHEAAKWLLAHGANLNAVDANGMTVFDYARRSNTLRTDRFFRRDLNLPATNGREA